MTKLKYECTADIADHTETVILDKRKSINFPST